MAAGIVNVTESTWDAEVGNYKGAVVVDFWAPWCGPCKMLTPRLEELAGELAGNVKFCKVDIDENGDLSQRFNVTSIPCLVFLKDGQERDRIIGGQYGKPQLKAWVDKQMQA
jgi:thioredoxin 1